MKIRHPMTPRHPVRLAFIIKEICAVRLAFIIEDICAVKLVLLRKDARYNSHY